MRILSFSKPGPNLLRPRFSKLLLIMKLSIIFILAGCLTVNAKGYSQNISISLENATIQKAFQAIRNQSDYQFLYTNKVLSKSRRINISIKDGSIQEVLDACFKDQPLTYTIIEKTVVVKLKKESELIDKKLSNTFLPPPPITISGKVVNDKGEPMVGVTVKVEGTNIGTSTDKVGNFELNVPDEKSVVECSFVGYTIKTFIVGKKRQFDITLSLADNKMQDVVVIGYGTQRAKDLTGAVSALSSKDFNQGLVLSPQQSIQGKVTGVNISQNSGKPGGSNTIRIRGGTSLTQSNDPLYVIDGVPISNSAGITQANVNNYGIDIFDEEPTNPLMTLNPDDIESVTVLKDASATAIYGSRGANGVIVITTKKGTAGKAKVSLGSSAGISKVEGTLDVLSADQYRQEISKLGLTIDDKGANTNWQDKIYRTGYSQDHYLALSGGADKTVYRA